MKKIFLILPAMLLAVLTLFTSCEDTDGTVDETISAVIGSGDVEEASVGDTIMFEVSIVAEDKLETIEVRKGTTTIDDVTDFDNPESHVYDFIYVVEAADAGKTLEFAFIITDKKDVSITENYEVSINGLLTLLEYEKSGSILGNKIGPNESAWNLVTNVRESGSATSDMQNPSIGTGTEAEQWIKGWDAETSTMFVKANDYDYENAAVETAESTYASGSASGQVRDVAVGDIYIAKIRGGDEYAVIKITKVDDLITGGASHTEEIGFDYKKSSESAGS